MKNCIARIAFACLTLWPGPSAAEILILAGKHESFTRLVFYFETDAAWEVLPTADGVQVRVPEAAGAFDASQLFERIPRTRLTAAAATGSELALTIGCACHVLPFLVTSRILALDIRDGPGLDVADAVRPRSSDPTRPQPRVREAPDPSSLAARLLSPLSPALDAEAAPAGSDDPTPPTPTAEADPEVPALPLILPAPIPADTDLLTPLPEPEPLDTRLGALLAEEIARAASQGLLEPSYGGETDAPLAPGPVSALDHIGAATNLDVALGIRPGATATAEDGNACVADVAVDVGAWGEEPPIWTALAERRAAVLGEFDRIDPDAALALARQYLNYGFGAEAKRALATFAPDHPERPLLVALADILDSAPLASGHPLEGQAGCASDVALWAVLAMDDGASLARADFRALVRALSDLPLHLRRLVGPPVAERLMTAGETETARALAGTLERAPGDHGPGFARLEAQLARADGDSDAAVAILRDVAASNGSDAPAALIALLEIWIEDGNAPPTRYTALAEATAFELEGSEDGDRLAALAIAARAAAAGFDAAAETYLRHDWVAPAAQRDALSGFLLALSETADDAAFLRLLYRERAAFFAPELAASARHAAARRLNRLGLPQDAIRLVELSEAASEADQLILAEAALRLGRPARALDQLRDLSSEAAMRLRADAFAALESYPDALASYGALGDRGRAAAAAWRAGDWDQVGALGTEAQRAAATLALAEAPSPPATPTLAAGAALLATSGQTRETIAGLLAELPPPAQSN